MAENSPLTPEERALAAGYVLQDLDENEQARARELLNTNTVFAQEVNTLQASLQLIPHGLEKVTPPPTLRNQILDAYGDTALEPPTTQKWPLILAAATGIISLLLGIDNLRLRSQLQFARSVEAQRTVALLQNPESRLVTLTGETVTANGQLLFTAGNWEEIILAIGNLPPLPPEEVYRLWLSLENGGFIFCGQFRPGTQGETLVRLLPPEQPPAGVKTTGIFVTSAAQTGPLNPQAPPIISGSI